MIPKSEEIKALQGLFYYREGLLYNKVNRHKNPKDSPISNTPNGEGYMLMEALGKNYKVHRVIFAILKGYFPEEIDHVNGNRLDNRIENLRACTHLQNSYNLAQRKGVSGVQGVSKCGDKWRVRLGSGGRRLSLGLYEDLELAQLVVEEARDKYHKEYNVLRREICYSK